MRDSWFTTDLMRTGVRLSLLTPLVLLGSSSEAWATTVELDRVSSFEVEVVITAEPGEANDIAIDYLLLPDEQMVIEDDGAPIEGEGDCSGGGPAGATVTCDFSGADELFVILDAGDRSDRVRLRTQNATAGVPAEFTLGGGGDDLVSKNDSLLGDEQIWPGPGDDRVLTGYGESITYLTGVEGGPDGADQVEGRGERRGFFDIATYEGREDDLSLTFDDQPNDGAPGEGDFLEGIDWLEGGAGDDVITGDARFNTLWGGLGADTLTGRRSRDILHGMGFEKDEDGEFPELPDPAADDLSGSHGPDRLYLGEGDDVGNGGKGRDEIYGGLGEDLMSGGRGRDEVEGVYDFWGVWGPDNGADTVDCGPAGDFARLEEIDTSENCEEVQIGPETRRP